MMEESKVLPKVQKILRRLDKSQKFKQKYIPLWKELDEFYRSDQYKNSKLPPWVPKPVTNFIHLVVTTKRAALSGENPMAMMRPQSKDDIERVRSFQKVYEWVWKKIKARSIVRDNIETAKLLGTAIAYVYWDENTGVLGGTNAAYEGEIRMKEIDPMNFHVDPNAYRLEDAEWVHVTEKRSRTWVEKEFDVDLKEVGTQDKNFGEEYSRDYYKENDKEDGMIDFHSHYERYWNTDKVTEQRPKMGDDQAISMDGSPIEPEMEEVETDEEIGGWNYKVTYIAGTKEVGSIDPLEPNMYPFAVLYDFKQRQEFWGRGTAGLILENQKLVNKVEGIIAMIGTLLQNPQKVITKASGINPREAMKYAFAPGHVWVTNGNDAAGAMHWQTPPDIPMALTNLAESAKENIREITGMNEAYMGQSVGSLQTSGGVNSLIDRATMRDKDQMFDIEQYVEQLTRIILGFVTSKYTEPRWIRLASKGDPEQPEDFKPYIGVAYADLEYDLDIDVSAQAPVTQARREAEMDKLFMDQYQFNVTPVMIKPQEYVKRKNMVDADELIARMDRDEQQSEIDILTQVASMMSDAMADGNIPPEEIEAMARQQITGIKSGEIPLGDPMQTAPGGPAMAPSVPPGEAV
jgi:hypothetical protein